MDIVVYRDKKTNEILNSHELTPACTEEAINNYNNNDGNTGYAKIEHFAYAIGQADPMSVRVITDGLDAPDYIYRHIRNSYKLTPAGMIDELGLLGWDYEKVAEGCHFRENMNWHLYSNIVEVEV